MGLTPKLELRQGQSLVMTPPLVQAIKLLQMSQIELADFIETEVERNPLLEREDAGEEGEIEQSAQTSDDGISSADWLEPSFDTGEITGTLDTGKENFFAQKHLFFLHPPCLMNRAKLTALTGRNGPRRASTLSSSSLRKTFH